MITLVTGHTVSMIAIRFFDMENRRKRKSGKEAIARRDQRLNPVLSGRSLIWLIISGLQYITEMNSSDVRRTEPRYIPNFIKKNGTDYCSQICVLPFLWKSSSLAYFFLLFLSSLSLFPSKGTFQRFVENKFEPRFGNANSIEISADVIYKTRAFFGDLIINDILDILNYSISSSNFF